MTTDTGSVWDRGPGEDDEVPRDAAPSELSPPEPSSTDASPPEPRTPELSAAETSASDPHPDASPTLDPSETVWSRGPSPDAIVSEQLAAPGRRVPAPVLPPAATPVARPRTMPQVRRPAKVLAGVLVVVLFGALAWSLGVVGGDDSVPALASDTSVALLPVVSLPSSTTATAPASPATTAPTTIAPTTSTSTTSTTSTTTSTTSSTTTTSTTSTTVPSAVTTAPAIADPSGPQVVIVGRVGPCRFGSDCLVADFTISDFTSPQREFVCDFGDGSRYTFRFDGRGAEQACSTSAADGSITIEVGGVRSETITR